MAKWAQDAALFIASITKVVGGIIASINAFSPGIGAIAGVVGGVINAVAGLVVGVIQFADGLISPSQPVVKPASEVVDKHLINFSLDNSDATDADADADALEIVGDAAQEAPGLY